MGRGGSEQPTWMHQSKIEPVGYAGDRAGRASECRQDDVQVRVRAGRGSECTQMGRMCRGQGRTGIDQDADREELGCTWMHQGSIKEVHFDESFYINEVDPRALPSETKACRVGSTSGQAAFMRAYCR